MNIIYLISGIISVRVSFIYHEDYILKIISLLDTQSISFFLSFLMGNVIAFCLPQDENTKDSESDPNKKPPYSYVALIAMAIKESPDRKLQVSEGSIRAGAAKLFINKHIKSEGADGT